ncbi:GPI mannosyltransferase 2 [Euphorbia peplus]|nr:GPI mannosyltransferase 2 [Euphorbia peplus]
MTKSMKLINPANNHQTLILKSATTSRLLVIALIILWRTLLAPYDTSSPLNANCLFSNSSSDQHQSIFFPRLASMIEGSIVWDSVYFVRIAECGYEYEQSYAFLPLLPVCISFLSHTVLAPLVPLIGHRAVLALAGYGVNFVAFVLAALYFYRLSVVILKDPDMALQASILFCFNPASIFYSSIYSESLYSLFSLGGLYHLLTGGDNIAVLWFALSGCARSNGVLNAGYLGFQMIHKVYNDVFLRKRASLAVQTIIVGALRCICTFLPFIAFQAYAYCNICHGPSLDDIRPWCKYKIPMLYNYIQSHYWGVGFLRYFQFKQLPNFLLASPVLSLAVCSIVHHIRLQPQIFFSLGIGVDNEQKGSVASKSSVRSVPGPNVTSLKAKHITSSRENHNLRERKAAVEVDDYLASPEEQDFVQRSGRFHTFIIPCTLHLGFMATTAFFIMHVQVATRFLSSSPPLYWFAAYITMSGGATNKWGYLIWTYTTAYILLGSLLFSNFYPFT